MKALVLINQKSGGVQKTGANAIADIATRTATKLGDIDLEIVEGEINVLLDAIEKHPSFDVVAAAGGDGTQAAAAAALAGGDAALLPLPCGTINLLCRDLGIPLDIEEAIRIGFCSGVSKIDVGVVGDRVFLNNVVFGTYSELAEAREELRDATTLDDVSFGVVSAANAIFQADAERFEVSVDDKTLEIDTNTIVVSNNEISHAEMLVPHRRCLDAGNLVIYLARAQDGADFARLLAAFARGEAAELDDLKILRGRRCRIHSGGAQFSYSIDGDPVVTEERVTLELRPRALRVMTPHPDD